MEKNELDCNFDQPLIFLCHAKEDKDAVKKMCLRLENGGFDPWFDETDILPGQDWNVEIRKAIKKADFALICVSKTSVQKRGYLNKEIKWALDRQDEMYPDDIFLIVAKLEECDLPDHLAAYQWCNLFEENGFERLLKSLRHQLARLGKLVAGNGAGSRRVVLVHKKDANQDERLANLLEEHLTKTGHRVFVDRQKKFGIEWAKKIAEEIETADVMIVLLSQDSIHSEMLVYEIETVHEIARGKAGKPALVPIRVNLEGALPYETFGSLEQIRHLQWRTPDDDEHLAAEINDILSDPFAFQRIKSSGLEMVSGAVPLDSKFYIERAEDGEFNMSVLRGDSIILVKGARQVGKTSMLARGIQAARENDVRVVLTDLQKLVNANFQNLDSFFRGMGELLADQLELDISPSDNWKTGRNPNTNFERFIKREILGKIRGHLLWAMDEIDRLFNYDFSGEVFSLLRTWHNSRALDPAGPWSRLTLAIAYATEANLFIRDLNQSPFNVGTKIWLDDFNRNQIAELNRLHGSPLGQDDELDRFHQLVGGHPFLVRSGLNEIVRKHLAINEFETMADRDDGFFGDHLQRILVLLARNPKLRDVVRQLLENGPCPDFDSFYRLRSAGIFIGASKDEIRPRCEIYSKYLKRHLA